MSADANFPDLYMWFDYSGTLEPDDDDTKDLFNTLKVSSASFEIETASGKEKTVAGVASIQVYNEDGDFSPEITSGAYRAIRDNWEPTVGQDIVWFSSTSSGSERRLACLFRPDRATLCDKVVAHLVTDGSPAGTIRAELWSVSGGLPSAILGTNFASIEYDCDTIGNGDGVTSERWSFRFERAQDLESDTDYAVVFITTGYTLGANGIGLVTSRVNDPFNRANSGTTLGNTSSGQSWVAASGTWGISSNEAYNASVTADDLTIADCGSVNGIVECKVTSTNYSSRPISVVFRSTVSGGSHLSVRLTNSAIALYKNVSGVYTSLDSASASPTNSVQYTIKVDFHRNVVKVYLDGTLKFTHTLTLSNYQTFRGMGHTYVGMLTSAAGSGQRWDDFRAANRFGLRSYNGTSWSNYTLADGTIPDGLFAVEEHGIKKGRMLYVESEYDGGGMNPIWTGFLDDWEIVDHQLGIMELKFVDRLHTVDNVRTNTLPLQSDTQIDEFVELVVQDYLYKGTYTSDNYSIGTENTVIKYGWSEGDFNARDLLELLKEAAGATHWQQAALSPAYDKYIWRAYDAETSISSDDDWSDVIGAEGLVYRKKDQSNRANRVVVVINPRRAGTANTVLWSYDVETGDGETIAAGDSIDMRADFTSPASAVTDPDNSTDRTAGLVVTSDIYGNHADLVVTNPTGSPIDMEKLQIRGTPLNPRHRTEIIRRDDALVDGEGELELKIDNYLVQNRDHAVWLADISLLQAKMDLPEPEVLLWNDFPRIIELRPFQRKTLWVTDVSPAGTYFVKAIRHQIQDNIWQTAVVLRRPVLE